MIKIILFSQLLFINSILAETKLIKSGTKKVNLIELFSTQSCSSCPPAQRWVSSLVSEKDIWKNFVPVVYHVDYWDYLGWKDPYSSPIYTKLQRNYASVWNARNIYTPMFVLNGSEWRKRKKSDYHFQKELPGEIDLQFKSTEEFEMKFTPKEFIGKKVELFASISGNKIITNVKAGENSGKNLRQDFLTLELINKSIIKSKNVFKSKIKFDKSKFKNQKSLSIAIWLRDPTTKKVIQTIGRPFNNNGFKPI